jgi:hypothetical protein
MRLEGRRSNVGQNLRQYPSNSAWNVFGWVIKTHILNSSKRHKSKNNSLHHLWVCV